jgi:aminopeptidase N
MGETGFRDGLRDYLKKYALGNATWADLIDILDRRTATDLKEWSRIWVEEPGRPTITTSLEVNGGKIAKLAFAHENGASRRYWPQQLRVTLGYRDKIVPLNVAMDAESAVAREAVGMPAPLYVLPNGGGWAYGGFRLDPTSREYLSTSLPDIPDALTRGAAWVTMWDTLLDRELSSSRFVELALQALPRESDEQLTQRVLGYLNAAWWRFLGSRDREVRAAKVEWMLRNGLANAKTASQKAAWFNAIRNVSLTPDTVTWLRTVWEKKDEVPGLPLAEADYSTLALELAVREVDGWPEILNTQLASID